MSDIDRWVEELGAALAAPDLPRLQRNEPGLDKKWRAGDIAAQIPKDRLEEVANRVAFPLGQLRSYADVARAYPPEERTVRAAWTIYREVRIVPPERRREILHDGLTLRQARIAVGKGRMDRPKREKDDPEERAWDIIDDLQNPEVRAIVEREMTASKVDRKARKTAKSTLDEIRDRGKFIEAEMRKHATGPTPSKQYWEASKELNQAARYAYTVARLHALHREVMSEEQWTDIVAVLRSLSDSMEDVADTIEGLAADDFVEGEDVAEFLELEAGDIVDAEVVGDE